MTHPDVSHQLRLAGLRVTRPRESVLEWLAEHPHSASALNSRSDSSRDRAARGSVSTQAVYDMPTAFTQHHHLVCHLQRRASGTGR
ncbi:MAG: hypothetical protein ACRDTG_29860 [Pseudonocardiaceae bacterium]